MNQQVISGTLVLIAPQTASPNELRDSVEQVCTVHAGPVVVLPHNWAAMPVELVRAQLDAIEARTQSQDLGPSKPPPPPPPPPAAIGPRVCKHCKATEGDGREGCLETDPPKHRFVSPGSVNVAR
jgi:hypothetical protein